MRHTHDGSGVSSLQQTRYARSGDVNIAYQVLGAGPPDLVLVPGWISHLEYAWEEPRLAHFYRRLASFARLILFDKRGTGLSDRVGELPTLERRMDDVRAVMDAAGSERAAIFGISEGGPMSALFAATYPERTAALVLYGVYAKRGRTSDYPWAPSRDEMNRWFRQIEREWGGGLGLDVFAPSVADDEGFKRWYGTYLRLGASPGAALAAARMNAGIDVRAILSSVRVPTLVLHRSGDRAVSRAEGRYVADRIPGAGFVELPGSDHIPWVGDADALLDEVQEFLTGARSGAMPDRVLATVLFVDVVDSTRLAASLGDRRWRELLEIYYAVVRRELARYRGREVDDAGDGLFATFDGPARAIGCATSILTALNQIGIKGRAGLHTGECEVVGDKVRGIAVHTGARVASLAGPGEILVSRTLVDLVAGSGIQFTDRGIHALKGIPGEWRLFAVNHEP
ncbi:MAG: adenylate/guanylate cyclase domain-containing protein [Chloroflexi bacterium]|nr:adenylate/guanylate cyclase domain-containing protein [Chloroflexota bacterium]